MGDTMSEKEVIQNATLHIIRPQKYQMAFWGLIILIGGIAIGSATTVLFLRHGPQGPMPGMEGSAQRMVEGMAHELNLTVEQQRLIEPLIRQHMAKLNDIRSKAQPLITEQFKLMHDEIAKVLTPEQLKLWEDRLTRIPKDFRPPMMPLPNQRFHDGMPIPGVPQQQSPGQQPGGPVRPDGQPRDSQPQQPLRPPAGPPPATSVNQQEDRVAAAVFDEQPAPSQNVASATTSDQPPQPSQQDDMMPPPPPDGGGPQDGMAPPPGEPMGPPPD
jgi:hypothetical protein